MALTVVLLLVPVSLLNTALTLALVSLTKVRALATVSKASNYFHIASPPITISIKFWHFKEVVTSRVHFTSYLPLLLPFLFQITAVT